MRSGEKEKLATIRMVLAAIKQREVDERISLDDAQVLSVIDKQEPTAEEIAKNFASVREQLLSQQHEEIFRVYIGSLTEKYEKGGAVRYSQKQAPPSLPLGK